MSTRLRTILVAALSLTLGFTAVARGEAPDPWQYPDLVNSKPFQRWWWEFHQRAYPLQDIPEGARTRAFAQIGQAAAAPPPAAPVSGNTWTNIGPAPISGGQIGGAGGTRPMSGRIGDIAVDPTNMNHWLIGAAQGGVWETTNAGTTWTAKTDSQTSLAIGAIAFAPSNTSIIYAGTGEGVFGGDSYAGAGLLKSTDGGTTWALLGTSMFAKSAFTGIVVNPSNASIVLATTAYGIAGRGGEFAPGTPIGGIFKSIDGGTTWSMKVGPAAASDIKVDPTNFNRVYSALGAPFNSGSNDIGRSTDAGDTWSLVTGPWDSSGDIGVIKLAIAPSNPNVMYVGIQDSFDGFGVDGGLLGLWKTTNAWAPTPTWTQIDTTPTDNGSGVYGYCGWDAAFGSPSTQCWYNHELIVDPSNANVLYAGGTPLWKFDGTTWTEVSKTVADPANGIHVDQHSMAWAGSRLIVGNDGGVWSTTDGGNTWADHNTNLAITQFYDGSVHPTNANFALGGSQDNGTQKWTGADTWQWIAGGDGGGNAISASAPNTNWAVTSQNLGILRTTDGGTNFFLADSGIDKTGVPFIARIEKCPANDDVFIAGTDNLWKSTNFFSGGTASWSSNGPEMGERITALAFAASDGTCNTYAFGTESGQLQLTTNGGTTWADIDTGNAVPNRYATDLAFDPTNASVLYVTLSGFDEGTPGQPGHVFKTMNGGTSWSNVTPPVNIPHNSIALDPFTPAIVYVGTDLGVWKSTTGGGGWTQMGPSLGMPNVAVYDLKINTATDRLVAFTHGRSAFKLTTGVTPTPTLSPTPTPTPTLGSLDHFTCYKAGATSGSVKFPGILNPPGISLVDQFGSAQVAVKKPKFLCAPTDKNGEDPSAPTDPEHLKMYQIKNPLKPVLPTNIKVVDQFNPTGLFVNAKKSAYMLVPAVKSLTGPTPVPTPGAFVTDHFECYKIGITKNTPKFVPQLGVSLGDQFGAMTVDVKKPAFLCNPVDKEGEDPTAPTHIDHLFCYKAKQVDAVKFVKIVGVFVNDQFGSETLDVKKPTMLCVPALENP